MPAAPSSPRSSTRPGSHRSERNRPVPLSLVAGIGAMSGVLIAANEVPSNKKTLKHYGSMRSLLQAHASPTQVIQLNFGIRVDLKLGTAPISEQLDLQSRRIAETVFFARHDDPFCFVS